ncbi:MAG TPA: hypothetical protein VHW96_08825 [Solirubrobacteraceae bacterium]|jgi:hypothetical protein|nr:hypothetical protein [Solirubrobacteraceae bacterium]
MGLLDDAIRDHLDLKRRRGADPGEVQRAEREALGPVRRNPTPAELAEAEAADAPADAPVYEETGDDGWSHDSLQDPVADAGAPPVYDEAAAEAPFEEPHDEEPAHEPFPAAPPSPPAMGAGPETAEYNVEDALAAEEPHEQRDGDDDVLEETPEFLQDTPDHDRLWFEQRPPKDFDFDE